MSWFDLSQVRASKPKRRAKGLVVTVKGIELYTPPRVQRIRSGKVTEVIVTSEDGRKVYKLAERSVSTVKSVKSGERKKKVRIVKEEAREVAAPVAVGITVSAKTGQHVAPVIEVSDLVGNVDTSWHEVGKGSRPLASYAARRAAVKAARGW